MEKILDDFVHENWGKFVNDQNKLLWEGKPLPVFNFSPLIKWKYKKATPSRLFNFLILWGVAGVFIWLTFSPDSYFFVYSLLLFFPILFLIIGDIKIYYKKLRITYAATEKGVLFKYELKNEAKITALNYGDIKKIRLLKTEDRGLGTIVFELFNEKLPLRYDTFIMQSFTYPTFELIEDARDIYALIQEAHAKNPRQYPQYVEPLIPQRTFKLIKLFLIILMVGYLANAIRMYFFEEIPEGGITAFVFFFLLSLLITGTSWYNLSKKKGINSETAIQVVIVNGLFAVIYFFISYVLMQ